jgi:hypothetical protein
MWRSSRRNKSKTLVGREVRRERTEVTQRKKDEADFESVASALSVEDPALGICIIYRHQIQEFS